MLKPLKDAGCLVLADVASVRHAEKAVAAGVDGLVLLTAGAGGQTGWVNPFAFVRAVRTFWDGIVVMAGGMADGQAIAAAEALGCDLAYMGTKFIATRESLAKDAYKEMLVKSRLDDVLLTRAFTGLETNMLRPSIAAAGLDPDNLPVRGAIDIAKDINAAERDKPDAKRWKDIWSAGHSCRVWPTCRRSPSWSSGRRPSTPPARAAQCSAYRPEAKRELGRLDQLRRWPPARGARLPSRLRSQKSRNLVRAGNRGARSRFCQTKLCRTCWWSGIQ